jgi:hypothetical protein
LIGLSSNPLSENPDLSFGPKKKNKVFSEEINLKIPLLSRGLKLSILKPGGRVAALHFFLKYKPTMAFSHRAQSDKCFFKHLIPGLTPVLLLKRERGFEIVAEPATPTVFTSMVVTALYKIETIILKL